MAEETAYPPGAVVATANSSVTNKVFLLSPQNVDGAAEAFRLAQDGFFNQS